MKRWLTVLLALTLLLAGCAEEALQETEALATKATAAPTEPDPGIYDPGHAITGQTGGAVLAYPLDAQGYAAEWMGDKILLSLVCEDGLQLTLRAGDACVKEAQTVLAGMDAACRIWAGVNRIACYDPEGNTLILLDGKLRELERLPVPEAESVEMDSQLTTLYYSTDAKLCAMDVETGISRLLRQSEGHSFQITGIEEDRLLQCWTVGADGSREKELISCQNGQVSYSGTALHSVTVTGDSWTAIYTDGPVTQWLYGSRENVQVFRPALEGTVMPLADGNILMICKPKDVAYVLEMYDMGTGMRSAAVTLKDFADIRFCEKNETGVWFVAADETGGETLCCWKPELSGAEPVQCLFTRYTRENPDKEALAQCSDYARKISQDYGITVSLEAPEALLQDYRFQEEYHADAIYTALETLEQALAQFPDGFYTRVVRATESKSFSISLVREVTGAAGQQVADTRGLQAWVEGDSYIVLPVGEDTLQQFYHQLWHMTETYAMNRNSVLDTWERLNPEGFTYLESYVTDGLQPEEAYLTGETRAFIDAYSMTYPREDRARIMEYAIMEGNGHYFESEIMQAKLNSLCWSIRRAFKWEDSKEVFPWEQYLKEPPHGSII